MILYVSREHRFFDEERFAVTYRIDEGFSFIRAGHKKSSDADYNPSPGLPSHAVIVLAPKPACDIAAAGKTRVSDKYYAA